MEEKMKYNVYMILLAIFIMACGSNQEVVSINAIDLQKRITYNIATGTGGQDTIDQNEFVKVEVYKSDQSTKIRFSTIELKPEDTPNASSLTTLAPECVYYVYTTDETLCAQYVKIGTFELEQQQQDMLVNQLSQHTQYTKSRIDNPALCEMSDISKTETLLYVDSGLGESLHIGDQAFFTNAGLGCSVYEYSQEYYQIIQDAADVFALIAKEYL